MECMVVARCLKEVEPSLGHDIKLMVQKSDFKTHLAGMNFNEK